MDTLRRLESTNAATHTAATARNRLLCDQTMRRHQPNQACLSPAEQARQAVLIAQSFKQHYLAEIRYLDHIQTTVAVIKPVHARAAIHEICVFS